jgi:hypothetical protein
MVDNVLDDPISMVNRWSHIDSMVHAYLYGVEKTKMVSLSVYDAVSLLGFNRFSPAEQTLARLQNRWNEEKAFKKKIPHPHDVKEEEEDDSLPHMCLHDALEMLLEPEDKDGGRMEDDDDDIVDAIDVKHIQRITYCASKKMADSIKLIGTMSVMKKGQLVRYAHDVKRMGKVYRKMWENDRLSCLLLAWIVDTPIVFYREFNSNGKLVHIEMVRRNDIEISNYLKVLTCMLVPPSRDVRFAM